jgi:hypothetical protein
MFKFHRPHTAWVVSSLKTVTSNHRDLQRISIYFPFSPRFTNEDACNQWRDIDHILIHLWELHSIRVNAIHSSEEGEEEGICDYIEGLLPEMAKGGGIDIVNSVELRTSRKIL